MIQFYNRTVFFDKFNLNYKEELLNIGEERKGVIFYTHCYTQSIGFNILKDFFYFDHDVDTFVILYPLAIQKLQNQFFCSEFIFYNSFKIDLGYDDIVPKTIEEENIFETETNSLNTLDLDSFFLKKKRIYSRHLYI